MQRNKKLKSKKIKVNGEILRIGIVVSGFHSDITNKLLTGARKDLLHCGISIKNIKVVRAPGSFELPLACQKMAKSAKYHGLIALGCVIKGETDHYYYIAGETAAGIMKVMLKYDIPIGFGVLTTDTVQQAKARSSVKENKGVEAARAVVEMLSARF